VRSREARFIGHGNFTQGEGHCRINAWRLTCSQCHDIKVIAMPHGDLPPNLLIKKFHQAGWNVGKRAVADLCGACQKKLKQGQAVAIPAPTIAVPPPDKPPTPPPPDDGDGVITITVLRYKELTEAWQAARLERVAGTSLTVANIMNIHALLCAGKVDDARQAIEAHLPGAKATSITPKAARITPAETIKRDSTFDEWLNNLEKTHRANHVGLETKPKGREKWPSK
jgi:hypothetical protein